jgi:hypothetical protein
MHKLVLVCNSCGASYWTTAEQTLICPTCLQPSLVKADSSTTDQLFLPEPEGVIPFSVNQEAATAALHHFIQQIPFKPRDLTINNLTSRLQRVYLPLWWVDMSVKAQWQADVGYDYEVVSHQDAYKNGWHSREVRETRLRWEPRVGEINRSYNNIGAVALDNVREFTQEYQWQTIIPARDDLFDQALIRVAQRDTAGAWYEASMNLRNTAADECRNACKAQQIRQFQWTAEYANQNWTQLMLPVFVTYYTDVSRKRHWIAVNGQTGAVRGDLFADQDQAFKVALRYLAIAAVVMIIGIALIVLTSSALGTLLVIGAVLGGLFTFYPILSVVLFNNAQRKKTAPPAMRPSP